MAKAEDELEIVVTGATGDVGGRLVPLLIERGHEVRTTTANPDREQPWWGDRGTVVLDALAPDQVAAACEGVGVGVGVGVGADDPAATPPDGTRRGFQGCAGPAEDGARGLGPDVAPAAGPAWASGGNDGPAPAKVVDAAKDTLPTF